MKDFTTLKSVLKTELAKKGYEASFQLLKLRENWQMIVGKALNRQSYPLKLEKSKLTIIIQDSIYKNELRSLKKNIISMSRVLLEDSKAVKDLAFLVGNYHKFSDNDQLEQEANSPLKSIPLEHSVYSKLKKKISNIENPRLRRAFVGWTKNIKSSEKCD